MNTELVALLDESRKPVRHPGTRKVDDRYVFYVVAGAVILRGDLGLTRRGLLDIAAGFRHSLHYAELSPTRRLEAIERIDTIDSWDGHIFETRKQRVTPDVADARLRAKTLETAIPYLARTEGVTELVLETRSMPGHAHPVHDNADHRTLNKVRDRVGLPKTVTMRHDTKAEPLLWIADLMASARTDILCGKNAEPYTRLGHRIRTTCRSDVT